MRKYLTPSKLLAEREFIRNALTFTVSDLKRMIQNDPDDYEDMDGNASIDVRLCVNTEATEYNSLWIIRTGLVDFDAYHSPICAASSVTPDTDLDELLDDLLGQALDQLADLAPDENE